MLGAIVTHVLSLLLHGTGAWLAARLARGSGQSAWYLVCLALALHGLFELVAFATGRLDLAAGLATVTMLVLVAGGLALLTRRSEDYAQAFEAQRESERRFRAVFDHTFQFLGVLDPDGKLREVNRTALGFVRVTARDVLGLPFWETAWWNYDPDVQAKVRAAVERARAGEFVRFEVPTHNTSGIRSAVDFSLRPVIDEQTDATLMLIAEGRDLTELRRTEAALASTEKHFRALIENASDVMLVLDADLVIRYASPSAERVTGLKRRRITGRNAVDIVHPDDRKAAATALASAAQHTGQAAYCTHRVRHLDSSWLVFESAVTAMPGRDGLGGGFVVNSRDVTERARLEQKLRQASKMEAVGSLAAGVAHDFNNLLTAILGYSDVVLLQVAQDAPLRRDVREIRAAGERAAALTRQLLAFSRQQILQPTVVQLNDVVGNVQLLLRRLIGAHIRLETHLDADIPAVLADPGQIEQVIINLAVNARDAMPRGGRLSIETAEVEVTPRERLRHEGLQPGRYVQLVVSDDGEGMDDVTLRRIFEPFFTTKAMGKGTGLGLATVYGIVKQSGGFIYADSRLGAGATFTVYLPPAEVTDVERTRTTAPHTRGGSETILLAEDEDAVRVLVGAVLEDAGYQVLTAADGAAALELAESHDGPIDLVIADVVMPGLVGPELVRRLERTRHGLPVLYVTGYAGDLVLDLELHGSDAVLLQKPFSPSELTAAVREMLDSAQRSVPTG